MEGAAFLPRVGSAAGSFAAAGSLAASPLPSVAGSLAGSRAGSRQSSSHRRTVGGAPVPHSRGWPKGLRPIFLDELPPRLEDVREKIAAVDRDLGRLCGDKTVEPAATTLPVNSLSAGGEPESEASPSSRRLNTVQGLEQELDALAEEDLTESIVKVETELLELHKSWRDADEERHRAEQQRDHLAARVRATDERADALCAEVTSLNGRLVELEMERQALRSDLGVSEADVQALRPLVEEVRNRVGALNTQSHELHARLYVAQEEVKNLRSQVEREEQDKALKEEQARLLEAEREERRLAVMRATDRLREQLEDEMAEERREADRRERELKLALASAAQRQQAAEESIKRVTGAGIPAPPRWFRSATPALLTRRKRFAHGMMPAGAPLFSGAPSEPGGEAPDAGEQEQPRSPEGAPAAAEPEGPVDAASASSPPEDGRGQEQEEATEDEGDDSFALDPEAAAVLEALVGEGMRTAVPELLFAAGLQPSPNGKPSVGFNFLPATCKIDLLNKSLHLQVLEPTGVVRKVSLVEISNITRPEHMKGAVEVSVVSGGGGGPPSTAEVKHRPEDAKAAADVPMVSVSSSEPPSAVKVKQRLRITAVDEDSAAALVAAISHPDRIIPGSCLVSGRNSSTETEVDVATNK